MNERMTGNAFPGCLLLLLLQQGYHAAQITAQ
jgi:hypothetical protein